VAFTQSGGVTGGEAEKMKIKKFNEDKNCPFCCKKKRIFWEIKDMNRKKKILICSDCIKKVFPSLVSALVFNVADKFYDDIIKRIKKEG